MATTVETAASGQGFINAGSTFDVNTGVPAADDFILAACATETTTIIMAPELTTDLDTPLGDSWTVGFDGTVRVAALYDAAGTEDANLTFENDSGGVNDQMVAAAIRLSGVDNAAPFRVTPAERHTLFQNNDGAVTVPSIGGSANSEPNVEVGDIAIVFHYMMASPFGSTGAMAGPTGTTSQVVSPAAFHQNMGIFTRELQAGDISSGTYTPGAMQSTYDAGEGDHNNYTFIVVLKPISDPPAYTETPNVSGTTAAEYTLSAEMTENCTLYAVAVAKGQSAPTIAQVKAGNGAGDVPALASASKAFSASTQDTMTLGGSLTFPVHDVYAVAGNSGGDASLITLADEALNPATGKQHVTAAFLGITAATQANPVELTVTGHNLPTGQEARIFGSENMSEINSPPLVNGVAEYDTFTSTSANTLTIDGEDGTGYAAFSGTAYLVPGISVAEGANPAVVDGDVWVVDTVTTPGGYSITFNADGTYSYDSGGDDSRQSFAARTYDVSAEALTAEVTQYANNRAPSLINEPVPVQFLLRSVAMTLDMKLYVEDIESDALTWLLVGEPVWASIDANGVISGTPTEGIVSDSFDVRAIDSLGYVFDTTVSYSVQNTATVPNVVDTPRSSAITQVEAAGFEQVDTVQGASGAVAVGNVISQDPIAGTIHPLVDPVTITINGATVPVLSAPSRRRKRL